MVLNRDIIDDFFPENRDKIAQTNDFIAADNIATKNVTTLIKRIISPHIISDYSCCQNAVKIDDFIAIHQPINRAIYRD